VAPVSLSQNLTGPGISFGANYIAADGKPAPLDAGAKAFITKFVGWTHDGTMSKDVWVSAAGSTYRAAAEDFINGNLAYYYSGSWQVPNFAAKIGDNFDWVATGSPCGPAACTGNPGRGDRDTGVTDFAPWRSAADAAPDHRSNVAAALPRPVHDRGREPRQAAAPPDTSTPGDSGRRPRRDRGPCPDVAPGEGRTKEAGGGGQAEAGAPYPPRNGYGGLAYHPQFTRNPERRQGGGMATRRRTVWVRLGGRTSVHRAHVPGVPPRDSVREGWPSDDRQHLAALPAAQSV